MYKSLLLSLLALCSFTATAQLTDSFTDGNFTQNPAWTGDVTGFQINTQLQLQSNGPVVTGTTLQLATPCQAATGTTWEFYANLRLATSGSNYADVWLLADQSDLKASTTKGYFVRLGGTPDEVALFRQDGTGSPTYVVNGQDATLSSTTNNVVRVRVTRSLQDKWTLDRDLSGTGQAFVSEGTALDATYQRSTWCGVRLTYSSANSRNFFFDDFRVTDATPPTLLRASVGASRQLDVLYNELVAKPLGAADYRLSTGIVPVLAERDAADAAVVHLTFGADLPAGSNTLEASNVTDLYGNTAAGALSATFSNAGFATPPSLNQVLITEILADETPVVGLPASEYLELFNPGLKVIDLSGMRLLKTGSSTAAVFPPGATLLPGEYAVICGGTRAAQFVAYGKVFALSNFPSLGNAGDQLLLRGRDGRTVFELTYSDTWYKDVRKKDGGWALEMVDAANPCAGIDNWTASTDPSGGTPGRANAARATNSDHTPPALVRAVALSPTSLQLFFSEKLDSTTAAAPALYTLSPANPVGRAAPVGPDFRSVLLTLAAPLTAGQPATVAVQRTADCVGNAIGPAASATVALPSPVAAGDVVINEILFNPRPGGVDFVELLNRSAKYLDVQGWQVGSQKPDGSVENTVVSRTPLVLAPGQLLALTTRPDVVQSQYPTHDPGAFLALPTLPSFPDDEGTVLLTVDNGLTINNMSYTAKQHLALLDNVEGVSLERIRADGPSTAANFHSAASAVGYATPGRQNSQYQADPAGDTLFRMEPEVFTPDGDGQQDFTTLNYQLDKPGYAASVTVYDALGRPARRLVRNETLATVGFFQWDGLTDRGDKAAVGYYVVHIELFQPNGGQKQEYKKTVVLGARF